MNQIEKIERFQRINDKLSTSGQPTKNEIKIIAEEGFEVLINTRPKSEMDELFNEREIVENFGMKYFQIETDLLKPNMDELVKFLELMTEFNDKKVFLHCRANKRASGLLAIYRIAKLNWKKEEALDKVGEVWELDKDLLKFIDVQLDYLSSN